METLPRDGKRVLLHYSTAQTGVQIFFRPGCRTISITQNVDDTDFLGVLNVKRNEPCEFLLLVEQGFPAHTSFAASAIWGMKSSCFIVVKPNLIYPLA